MGSGVGGDYSVHVDYESEYEEGEGAEDDVSEEHAKVLLSMYPNTVVCKREEGGGGREGFVRRGGRRDEQNIARGVGAATIADKPIG